MRLAALMTLLAASAGLAHGAPPLANNPFERPGLVELAPSEIALPPLELRAVLAAGDASLADVGGQIVRVGDEVSGYRLVGVSEEGALFERDGRTLHVPLPTHAPPPAAVDDPALQAKESDGDAN